jgi:hypothetical protein
VKLDIQAERLRCRLLMLLRNSHETSLSFGVRECANISRVEWPKSKKMPQTRLGIYTAFALV